MKNLICQLNMEYHALIFMEEALENVRNIIQSPNTPYPVGRPKSRCHESFTLANIDQSNSAVS